MGFWDVVRSVGGALFGGRSRAGAPGVTGQNNVGTTPQGGGVDATATTGRSQSVVPVSPALQAARVANALHMAEGTRSNLTRTPAQRAEWPALVNAQKAAEATARDPKSRLSPADRAFVNPDTEEGQRNLRRAADPDQGLRPNTIDEARTMDLAERTGQLPGLVDRSGVPGADVKTTELDERGEVANQTDWSMKGVRASNPKQLAESMRVALGEIKALADTRIGGSASPEFIADLKYIQDEAQLAAIEQQLQQQLAVQNGLITQANSGQQPIQMRTILNPDILKARQDAARAAQAAGGAPKP